MSNILLKVILISLLSLSVLTLRNRIRQPDPQVVQPPNQNVTGNITANDTAGNIGQQNNQTGGQQNNQTGGQQNNQTGGQQNNQTGGQQNNQKYNPKYF